MARQKTVLFFARRFYPQIGGVEKHVLEVSKRLVKKSFRVIVITENYNISQSKNYQLSNSTDKIEGIEVLRIDTGSSGKLKKFRIWFKLLKHLKVINSADVIHCHDVFFWYLPFRLIFFNKPVYTTFHGYEGNNIPTKKAIFMHKLAEKLSKGNICIGKVLEKWYGTKATFISYGAIDVPQKANNKNVNKNLIIFLGRLEEETGIMEYLYAFQRIVKEYPELKLIVLGDGELRNTAENYVKYNKLNVEFKGFIDNTTNYIEKAAFIFVSRYLGILESMVNKKYVISVYNNKIKEDYLKMTPFSNFISISSNSNGVYKELDKYLTNEKQKNEKINVAFNWVKDQTWNNLVNLYLRLWNVK